MVVSEGPSRELHLIHRQTRSREIEVASTTHSLIRVVIRAGLEGPTETSKSKAPKIKEESLRSNMHRCGVVISVC